MTPPILEATVLEQAANELGGFLPRLFGAIVLLVVGILAARILARLLERSLRKIGLDSLAERIGAADALDRAGLPRSLARVLGVAVRVGLSIVVTFAALSLLGLEFLSDSLNQAILFLPKLLTAGGLLLAGIVVGGFARERVDRVAGQMDLPVPLGLFAQALVISIFAITAAAQIAVTSAILMVLVAIVLAAALGSVALSFGLGGREIAAELSAGRVVSGSFEIGQRIQAGELRGEIVGFDPVATLLRDDEGRTVRVPNRDLVSQPVVLISEPGRSGAG